VNVSIRQGLRNTLFIAERYVKMYRVPSERREDYSLDLHQMQMQGSRKAAPPASEARSYSAPRLHGPAARSVFEMFMKSTRRHLTLDTLQSWRRGGRHSESTRSILLQY
jgi:hypothetical protein